MRNNVPASPFVSDVFRRLAWLGTIALVAAAIGGCGKKAPPVAPRQTPLVAVSDLQARVDGTEIILTWQHPIENRRAAGYLVLRAQVAADQPPCPGCPQVFQKVQTLRLSKSLRNHAHTLTYKQLWSSDFRYTYSVRSFHASGRQGPDSNLVRIEGSGPVRTGRDKANDSLSNKASGAE